AKHVELALQQLVLLKVIARVDETYPNQDHRSELQDLRQRIADVTAVEQHGTCFRCGRNQRQARQQQRPEAEPVRDRSIFVLDEQIGYQHCAKQCQQDDLRRGWCEVIPSHLCNPTKPPASTGPSARPAAAKSPTSSRPAAPAKCPGAEPTARARRGPRTPGDSGP